MCCTQALRLASLLFVLALTNDPALLAELEDALRAPRQQQDAARADA